MTQGGSVVVQRFEDRFTEIKTKLEGGQTFSYGSGLLLGDGLILTARHVLVADEWPPEANLLITARPRCFARSGAGWQSADLVWPAAAKLRPRNVSDGPDVALIRLRSSISEQSGDEPLLGLGGSEDDVINVSAVGFPAFSAFGDPPERRDSHQIAGILKRHSGLVSETYEIEQLDLGARSGPVLGNQLNWHGFSGAPLFAQKGPTDRRLIGVVITHRVNGWFEFRAVRLDPLWEQRQDFAAAIAPGVRRASAMARYVSVPPLTSNYIERTEAVAQLREAITSARRSPSIAMIALQGMGGLGKTQLALAICHDVAVKEAFPDGIVWLPIGKESTRGMATLIREVAKTFGEDVAPGTDDLGAKNWYKTAIRNRAALIVLDDVWHARDLDWFRAEAPRSRVLFTTRDASMADAPGCHVITPDFLKDDEARELLARWSDSRVDDLPVGADDLIRECGGLSLAVATIGAMLRGKPRANWRRVYSLLRSADLGKLRQQFPDYPYPNLLAALQVSVDELEAKTRERYLTLALLLENMSIHPLIQRALWNAGEFDALDTAEELTRLALAQRDGDGESIRLHDLLLDYVRAQYPDPEALDAVHEALRLSVHIIENDPRQFATQIIGRLFLHANMMVRDFLERLRSAAPRPWLRPLMPALQPPGTGLLRTANCSLCGMVVRPDGRFAVLTYDDDALTIWDLETARVLETFEIEEEWRGRAVVTADGRRTIAISGSTLKVRDLAAGSVARTLDGNAGFGGDDRPLAITSDGRRAISGSDDNTLTVWDLDRGCVEQTLQGHGGPIMSGAMTPDGRRAISGSKDQTLKIWDLNECCIERTIACKGATIRALAITSDGRKAIAGSDDGALRLWDLDSGSVEQTLEGHDAPIISVSMTPEGNRAISASWGGTIKVWDIPETCARKTFKHTDDFVQVEISSDGRRGVSSAKDLKVWDLDRTAAAPTAPIHADSVFAVAAIEDGFRAVSSSTDGTIKLWDLNTGSVLESWNAPFIGAYSLTPDLRRALAPAADIYEGATVELWDLEESRVLHSLEHSHTIISAAITPDGRRAISASMNNEICIWDLEEGRLLRKLDDGALRTDEDVDFIFVALTPDATYGVSVSFENRILTVWDLAGVCCRQLELSPGPIVRPVAITRDANRVVVGGRNIELWDLKAGKIIASFSGDDNAPCCTFANDNVIVVGDLGGRVYALALEE